MKIWLKLQDFFYGAPILCDLLFLFIFWIINIYCCCFRFKVDLNGQLQISASIIGSAVSLAGFIIAALTIIVTFKSNQSKKKLENSKNALEMLLLSNHNYQQIIKVFRSAIIEMVICCITLYALWICSSSITSALLWQVNLSAILIISLALMRSITILFKLMHLEEIEKED